FGTYGDHVAGELARIVAPLLERLPQARVLLAGRGAATFASRLGDGTRLRLDVLSEQDGLSVAAALRACDVLVQPFPDGVTTRRTSMMAALSSARPVVTTNGDLTEPVWNGTAVVMAPAGQPARFVDEVERLAMDAARRDRVGIQGRQLYDERFA